MVARRSGFPSWRSRRRFPSRPSTRTRSLAPRAHAAFRQAAESAVSHGLRLLDIQILLVGHARELGGEPFDHVVDIHVVRHRGPPVSRRVTPAGHVPAQRAGEPKHAWPFPERAMSVQTWRITSRGRLRIEPTPAERPHLAIPCVTDHVHLIVESRIAPFCDTPRAGVAPAMSSRFDVDSASAVAHPLAPPLRAQPRLTRADL